VLYPFIANCKKTQGEDIDATVLLFFFLFFKFQRRGRYEDWLVERVMGPM